MGRLVVAVDRSAGVSPAGLAAAWGSDEEARAAGVAVVEPAPRGDFFGVAELVVVPLAVNLAGSAVTAIVGRLVAGLTAGRCEEPELEITAATGDGGDLVVVIRAGGRGR